MSKLVKGGGPHILLIGLEEKFEGSERNCIPIVCWDTDPYRSEHIKATDRTQAWEHKIFRKTLGNVPQIWESLSERRKRAKI